jgi:hypothetical protein
MPTNHDDQTDDGQQAELKSKLDKTHNNSEPLGNKTVITYYSAPILNGQLPWQQHNKMCAAKETWFN